MFAEFLNIVFSSLKLDRNLYKNNKNFGEAAIYFAGLIMILDGVAGAVAANTFIKTSIGISGFTAIWNEGYSQGILLKSGKLRTTFGTCRPMHSALGVP